MLRFRFVAALLLFPSLNFGADPELLFSPLPPAGIPNPFFAATVASVGDFNSDGIDDVAISSRIGAGDVVNGAGRVHLYSGATGAPIRTFASPNDMANGVFGTAIVGMGDITGDGVPELVIGAPNESTGASPANCGRAYIINGATGAGISMLASQNEQTLGRFGESVAVVPDLSGDGVTDIVVGARNESPSPSPGGAGRAYVFDGASGAFVWELASDFEGSNDAFGYAVLGIPDLNGDSMGEVVVSAPLADAGITSDAGRIFIFNGATGILLGSLEMDPPFASGGYGSAMSLLGDLSGDGTPEIVVGSRHITVGAERVDLVNPITGATVRTISSPDPVGEGFSYKVAGLNDVTDDGIPDVLTASFAATPSGTPLNSGRAYVFSGATGSLVWTMNPPAATSGGGFGISLAEVKNQASGAKSSFLIAETFPNQGKAHVFGFPLGPSAVSADWKSYD